MEVQQFMKGDLYSALYKYKHKLVIAKALRNSPYNLFDKREDFWIWDSDQVREVFGVSTFSTRSRFLTMPFIDLENNINVPLVSKDFCLNKVCTIVHIHRFTKQSALQYWMN